MMIIVSVSQLSFTSKQPWPLLLISNYSRISNASTSPRYYEAKDELNSFNEASTLQSRQRVLHELWTLTEKMSAYSIRWHWWNYNACYHTIKNHSYNRNLTRWTPCIRLVNALKISLYEGKQTSTRCKSRKRM